MRKTTCILLILLQCSLAYSQRIRKISVKSPELQAYVSNTPALDTLSFTYHPYSPADFRPDTVLFKLRYAQPYNNVYSMEYPDHRYLFETQFGAIPDQALQKMVDSVKKKYKVCEHFSLIGKITRNNVAIEIHEVCPEQGDDMIFTRIKYRVDYKAGIPALTQFISESIPFDIDWAKTNRTDSVLYYRIVIKRDSLAHDVKQMDGGHSPIETYIAGALARSRPWIPLEKGGIRLNAYLYVYVILHKDGTITVGYSKP